MSGLEYSLVQLKLTTRQLQLQSKKCVKEEGLEKTKLKKISMVMDTFESQFEDLDVQTKYMENTMGNQSALSTPQDEVDTLMHQVADQHGLEIGDSLQATPDTMLAQAKEAEAKEQDDLSERLRALRG
ncbi:Vacuolar-sorting protein SNF7 [Entomortierella chlamydospora]|uniref:Vacuolar-sorting protein SNF7 n=1 Tax=Entomortierella chlamydospora TaxID=101097 RepID=A0A9P6MVG9_9FUNG|nr:Vacuolar-sorting protein SNF7 [Entomortierella chlamydospora]